MRHIQTFYATSLANANEQTFTPAFKESGQPIDVKYVYCNIVTAGVTLRVHVGAKQIASIDCARFANGNPRVELDFHLDPQATWDYSIQDAAAGAHANFAVQFDYDTPNQ